MQLTKYFRAELVVAFCMMLSLNAHALTCEQFVAAAALRVDGIFTNPAHCFDFESQKSSTTYLDDEIISFVYGTIGSEPAVFFWKNRFTTKEAHAEVLKGVQASHPEFKADFLGSFYVSDAQKSGEKWKIRIAGVMPTPSQSKVIPNRPYTGSDVQKLVEYLSAQSNLQVNDQKPIEVSWPSTPSKVTVQEMLGSTLAP